MTAAKAAAALGVRDPYQGPPVPEARHRLSTWGSRLRDSVRETFPGRFEDVADGAYADLGNGPNLKRDPLAVVEPVSSPRQRSDSAPVSPPSSEGEASLVPSSAQYQASGIDGVPGLSPDRRTSGLHQLGPALVKAFAPPQDSYCQLAGDADQASAAAAGVLLPPQGGSAKDAAAAALGRLSNAGANLRERWRSRSQGDVYIAGCQDSDEMPGPNGGPSSCGIASSPRPRAPSGERRSSGPVGRWVAEELLGGSDGQQRCWLAEPGKRLNEAMENHRRSSQDSALDLGQLRLKAPLIHTAPPNGPAQDIFDFLASRVPAPRSSKNQDAYHSLDDVAKEGESEESGVATRDWSLEVRAQLDDQRSDAWRPVAAPAEDDAPVPVPAPVFHGQASTSEGGLADVQRRCGNVGDRYASM